MAEMSDLRSAILDAKYVDMIELADFIVRDLGLPESDESGRMLPQQTELAAAVFRWAAGAEPARRAATVLKADPREGEYDEHGDPIMDAAEAEAREARLREVTTEGDS
ncbi:hypothetical protein [Litorisediminicola beolgyonensis]|uniref:DUF3572 domain-containing protein n=1 Tax=Litorisediminicola beolgyonensis TaxID=1173614 RepID=A0ABW3ZM12_9RHOB